MGLSWSKRNVWSVYAIMIIYLVIFLTATLPSTEATASAITIIQRPQYILAAKKSKPEERQKLDNASSSRRRGPVAPVIIMGWPARRAKSTPPAHVKTWRQIEFRTIFV